LIGDVKRSRGRTKLTWDDWVKRDLEEWNIFNKLAMDKKARRLAINVARQETFVSFSVYR
jgi:hypothetical protein